MSGQSKGGGGGGGASGRGFRRTGSQPGTSRRGAFIVYTDVPETFGDTLIRMWKKLAIVLAIIVTGAVFIYSLQVGGTMKPNLLVQQGSGRVKVDAYRAPQAVYDFLDAESVEGKLSHLRDSGHVADSVRAFYAGRASAAESYRGVYPEYSPNHSGPDPIERFYVEMEGRLRIVAVVETGGAGTKIDWPAFAQSNPIPPESLLSGEAASGEFRVMISDFEYYAGEFADDRRFQSYRVTSSDLEGTVTAYVARGSELERELSSFCGPAAQRCVLSLSAVPGARSSRQLTVNALVARGWVLP